MAESSQTVAPRHAARIQRAWLLGTQAALMLPFLTVRSCADGSTSTVTGLGYYADPEHGVLLACLLGVLVPLLAWPWRGAPGPLEAAGLALRAWLTGLGAAVAAVGPMLAYLFQVEAVRVGWVLHAGGWTAAALAYLAGALVLLRRAPGPSRRAALPLTLLGLGGLVAGVPLFAAVIAPAGVVDVDEPLAVLAFAVGLAAPLAVAALALARTDAPSRVRALVALALLATVAFDVAVAVDGLRGPPASG